ncbi:hypothetical protein HanRHA438_Chr07g0310401 [Helianthus annuus]|nr:hypothetical protein HanRHA438_Chr07g0310401 [Helianthus annuus]
MTNHTSIFSFQNRKHNLLFHLSMFKQHLQQLRITFPVLLNLHTRTPHHRIPSRASPTRRQILPPPHHPLNMPQQTLMLQYRRPHHHRNILSPRAPLAQQHRLRKLRV